MKVWIFTSHGYDGLEDLQVFATEEAAQAELKRHKDAAKEAWEKGVVSNAYEVGSYEVRA